MPRAAARMALAGRPGRCARSHLPVPLRIACPGLLALAKWPSPRVPPDAFPSTTRRQYRSGSDGEMHDLTHRHSASVPGPGKYRRRPVVKTRETAGCGYSAEAPAHAAGPTALRGPARSWRPRTENPGHEGPWPGTWQARGRAGQEGRPRRRWPRGQGVREADPGGRDARRGRAPARRCPAAAACCPRQRPRSRPHPSGDSPSEPSCATKPSHYHFRTLKQGH